ncbi:MAG: tRNA 2-selenouridine(34) synthase MnmH [Bacteroidetes bacterium]|nr:tRNA 2-selenouridine(34) synthase MnmH [Bacteroidota bacterium]MBT5530527.1 tRNA 2-selenouridine(34) synthase MnmH [Cytophagia bacterium]MBT3935971.1 tRNA 2-selenouridine(34) synthase MnmH [Bacteroidota bacterium]MBT4338275.1 tRNA 2-selenouridine(34) synthase MnmH [Bacteroidota bacterium]MBT4728884.1 tRNA 2-selenouridine(34) synthase MnmH [Bacteroidota bacterium]
MPQKLNIEAFLENSAKSIIVDVRTPKEFASGHIPQAFNIPLFSNEERAEVGTIYKQNSKEAAIIKGLAFVGPKMADFVNEINKIAKNKEVYFYCWRGGMRSNSFAWLLETVGYKTYTLDKGYKAFRNHVLNSFEKKLNLLVIGGMTGSAKTYILYELDTKGHQIIDLEKMASHKGSSFGSIGEHEQPTNEQFENDLFHHIDEIDSDQLCFIEDESRMIGRINQPNAFYDQIRTANVIKLEISKELRIGHLVKEYSNTDLSNLLEASDRLKKRLGGLKLIEIRNFLLENDFESAASVLLDYYDKAYVYGLKQRPADRVFNLKTESINPAKNAQLILDYIPQIPDSNKLIKTIN